MAFRRRSKALRQGGLAIDCAVTVHRPRSLGLLLLVVASHSVSL